jgi:two-component system response regulator AtoC
MSSAATSKTGTSPTTSGLPPEQVLFGTSAAMNDVRRRTEKFCRTNIPVLLQGPGGTGKEILARWIHAHSPFSAGQFIKVNCAAIPGTLLESELFGYEKGAFTGAQVMKPGRVELAQNGTLFLDEIAELDPGLQAKLLHFLQDGRFPRIGGREEQLVDTRVICATNRILEDEIAAGRFRSDLFYRINVVRIEMPRLKERREDIPVLAEYFREQLESRFGKSSAPLGAELLELLRAGDWPGNIRELENRMARYVVLGREEAATDIPLRRRPVFAPLSPELDATVPLKRRAKEAIREMEKRVIFDVLQANRWNRRKAAQVLKISYRALIYKIREADLTQRNGNTVSESGGKSAKSGFSGS